MNNHVSRLVPAYLLSGMLLLALVLSGCGLSSTTAGSGAAPSTASSPSTGRPATTPTATTPGRLPTSTSQLACELQVTLRPIDSIDETLHCTVSNMPGSETAFVLHYAIRNNAGKPLVLAPVCQGSLSGGAGSCTAIISSALPQSLTRGMVLGSTQPNHYPLGPIVPKQVAGTTPTGTPLRFQPHG
jgi:hypothetical protein